MYYCQSKKWVVTNVNDAVLMLSTDKLMRTGLIT